MPPAPAPAGAAGAGAGARGAAAADAPRSSMSRLANLGLLPPFEPQPGVGTRYDAGVSLRWFPAFGGSDRSGAALAPPPPDASAGAEERAAGREELDAERGGAADVR